MKLRKNIMIGENAWRELKVLSKQEETSVSELIREAVRDLFAKRAQNPVKYDPVTDRFS